MLIFNHFLSSERVQEMLNASADSVHVLISDPALDSHLRDKMRCQCNQSSRKLPMYPKCVILLPKAISLRVEIFQLESKLGRHRDGDTI
jgi:hypothetical protein